MTNKPHEVAIENDNKGDLYISGKATDLGELQLFLEAAVSNNPTNQTVIIRADRTTAFQPVVSVMDVCNRTGVSDYSVTTKEGPES